MFRFSLSRSFYPGASDSELRWNPVVAAARSVAGMFAACFTSPETNNSKSLADSEEFKSSSVVSNASRASSQRARGSNRGASTGLYSLIRGKEPGIVKFTMEEIIQVTRNFSPSFKIGQGGFGAMYKTKLTNVLGCHVIADLDA